MQDPPTIPPPKENEYEKFVQQIAALRLRESEPFQQKLNQLRELYQPANAQEEYYLTQIAEGQLNLQRLGQLQAGLYTLLVESAVQNRYSEIEAFPEIMRGDSPLSLEQRLCFVLAQSFIKYAQSGKALEFFYRYHTQAKRNLRHDQQQFDRIRRQHLKPPPAPPDSPEPEPEPKPKVHLLTKPGKRTTSPKKSRALHRGSRCAPAARKPAVRHAFPPPFGGIALSDPDLPPGRILLFHPRPKSVLNHSP